MIIVDDSRKTVTVDKKEVDLTFTEYRVLFELIKANQKVLTRETLVESINLKAGRSIDQHVARLRKSLKKHAPCIRTRHRFGYCFVGKGRIRLETAKCSK